MLGASEGFSSLEIWSLVEERGCSGLRSHNFPQHPRGYPDSEWVFLGVLSGQALLAELFGTTSLRDPASLEGICCPNSLDKIQPSGSGVLGEASPVGAMIRRERPLEQGLDVLLPIPSSNALGQA